MSEDHFLSNLANLNRIVQMLNQAVDVHGTLNAVLPEVVRLLGLETGWIFLHDPSNRESAAGKGYTLAAYHNLPPVLAIDNPAAWNKGCDCQGLCNKGALTQAYNEVRCSRLAEGKGDRNGLTVHASTPLHAGDDVLGILNVAAPDWASFSEESLALLTNIGTQMGAALARARLFELISERRMSEQAALLRLSHLMLGQQKLEDLMKVLLEETRLLLNVDAAALLLRDESDPDYLRFYAALGWNVDPVAAGRRVPADARSGSGYVMQTGEPRIIPRTSMSNLPWMAEWLEVENFEGAAILPLIANDEAIGTLVVDTRQPLDLDVDDVQFLQLISNQAALAIKTAQMRRQEARQRLLQRDLAMGQQIQLSMLPAATPDLDGWDIHAYYCPAREVGGDFYDHFQTPKVIETYGLVIADVSGKGIPAALFMALARTTIRNAAISHRSPAEALLLANQWLIQDSRSDMFLTAFLGEVELKTGVFHFCNAGHNRPILYHAASDRIETIYSSGIVLGVLPEIELQEQQVQLEPDDVLLLYTDGVTEAMDESLAEYGSDRLQTTLAAHAHQTASEIADALVADVNRFVDGAIPSDDLTLLVIKRRNQ